MILISLEKAFKTSCSSLQGAHQEAKKLIAIALLPTNVCIFIFSSNANKLSFGKDLFWLESPFEYKKTGPFYDEAIAGGFIQRFSLFIFFSYVAFTTVKNNNIKIYTLAILFLIIISSIIFTGNRMPFILFLISVILIIITNKTLKKYLIQILIFITIISSIAINSNSNLKNYYKTFYAQTEKIVSLYSFRITGKGSELLYNKRPFYIHEFDSGVSTFKLNKFMGGGIKSFRS